VYGNNLCFLYLLCVLKALFGSDFKSHPTQHYLLESSTTLQSLSVDDLKIFLRIRSLPQIINILMENYQRNHGERLHTEHMK
jgi:hypothetical protein